MQHKALFFGDICINEVPEFLVGEDLLEIIKEHDLVSCNFEAPIITDDSQPIQKIGCHINQSIAAAELVKQSGFNVINLANNHVYDYGIGSLKQTLSVFEEQITVGAGLDFLSAYQLKTRNLGDLVIGFLSFCEAEFGALTEERLNRGGYAWVNHFMVDQWVKDAKKQVDILVVQVHAGVEEIEIPLPEWRERYKKLIHAGSDVVIAHHPHVPQGWEIYDGKPIFYSLGNFYFDLENSEPLWNRGYGVSLLFQDKSLVDFTVLPIERTGQLVRICTDKSYTLYLQGLSDLISSDKYYETVNSVVLSLWEDRYKPYYKTALNSVEGLPWQIMFKKFIKSFFSKKNKGNYLFLLHNLRIESHRWTVERALSLLEEDLIN